jgi:hypothetical protein
VAGGASTNAGHMKSSLIRSWRGESVNRSDRRRSGLSLEVRRRSLGVRSANGRSLRGPFPQRRTPFSRRRLRQRPDLARGVRPGRPPATKFTQTGAENANLISFTQDSQEFEQSGCSRKERILVGDVQRLASGKLDPVQYRSCFCPISTRPPWWCRSQLFSQLECHGFHLGFGRTGNLIRLIRRLGDMDILLLDPALFPGVGDPHRRETTVWVTVIGVDPQQKEARGVALLADPANLRGLCSRRDIGQSNVFAYSLVCEDETRAARASSTFRRATG